MANRSSAAVADALRARGQTSAADIVAWFDFAEPDQPIPSRTRADGSIELDLIGDIGGQITAAAMLDALRAAEGAPVWLNVSSYGGSAIEGFAIHSLISRHPKPTTVFVLGVAASAASVIAAAGSDVIMPTASFLMIHEAAAITLGTRREHEEQIAMLRRVDDAMAGIYAARTGLPATRIAQYMRDETWFAAAEAVRLGFADRIEDRAATSAPPVTASAKRIVRAYRNTPAAMLPPELRTEGSRMSDPANTPEPGPAPAPAPAPAPEPGPQVTPRPEPEPEPETPPAPEPEPEPADPNGPQVTPRPQPEPEAPAEPGAPPAPVATLKSIAARGRLPDSWIVAQIERGATERQARDSALAVVAAAVPRRPATTHPGVAVNTLSTIRAAVAARGGIRTPEATAAANLLRGATLRDLAAEFVAARDGVRPGYMAPDQLFRLAFNGGPLRETIRADGNVGMITTSDFATLIGGAAEQIVLDSYAAAPTTWRTVSQTFNVDDFRARQLVGGFDLPDLEQVPEHGEIKYGAVTRQTATIQLAQFARGFSFSRQAMLNNDLDEFVGQSRAYGAMAARSLNNRVWRLFQLGTTSAITTPNGNIFFSVANANLATGSAITATSLAAAESMMLAQTNVPGRPLGLVPTTILVGVNRRGEALSLLGSQRLADNTDNRFYQALRIVYVPEFPANAWAITTDAAARPIVGVPLLNGVETPQVATEQHFDTFGVKIRVSLDYEAAPLSHIGIVYNPGV